MNCNEEFATMLARLELILSNIQSENIDYLYINKLYDDVEISANTLASTSVSPHVMESVNSLLETFKLHKRLLQSLQNARNQSTQKETTEHGSSVYEGDERTTERVSAIDSMKLSFEVSKEGGLEAVVGLEDAKQVLKEACIIPFFCPHLFKGAIRPWRRILLYGPPGGGKTLLAKGLAEDLQMEMYCVSTAALFSVWIGESEKMIRDLFKRGKEGGQNLMIFMDEIDSICRERTHAEDEHSRRVKTELLRQLDGISPSDTSGEEPLILAATNCPWDLDPAFLRRFQRRIYVGLPTRSDCKVILESTIATEITKLDLRDWERILDLAEGFSGADLSNIATASAMIPIKELYETHSNEDLKNPQLKPRPVAFKDFEKAIQSTTKTVSVHMIRQYAEFSNAIK